MSKLDSIAIKNLETLVSLNDNIEDYQLVVDGYRITQSDDENYEGIFSLRELEYPIFFSFNQLLNSIRYSNLYKIDGYQTNKLLHLMDDSIDKVIGILDKMEEDPHNNSLCEIIDEIDNKYLVVSERNNTCSFWKIYETFNDYLDTFSEALSECNRYLYISSHYSPAIQMIIEEVNEETGETNSNLIYSDSDSDSPDSENIRDTGESTKED